MDSAGSLAEAIEKKTGTCRKRRWAYEKSNWRFCQW